MKTVVVTVGTHGTALVGLAHGVDTRGHHAVGHSARRPPVPTEAEGAGFGLVLLPLREGVTIPRAHRPRRCQHSRVCAPGY